MMSAVAFTRHILSLRSPAGAQPLSARGCFCRKPETPDKPKSSTSRHRLPPSRVAWAEPTNLGNASCNSGGNPYSGGINFNNNIPLVFFEHDLMIRLWVVPPCA